MRLHHMQVSLTTSYLDLLARGQKNDRYIQLRNQKRGRLEIQNQTRQEFAVEGQILCNANGSTLGNALPWTPN